MRELPSGGVTFCFTDIEGSSAVNSRLGDDAYGLVLDRHRDLLRVAWAEFGGVEVSTEGDGCFVAFHDGGAAVNACQAAQALIGSEPWPNGATIRVRMGVHSGVAHPTRDGDYVSIVVSQAARVAASAHGGQVVVSATTAGAVEPSLLRPLGRYRLRDFADPIELFQLVPSDGAEFPPLRGARAIDLAASVGIPSWLRVEDRWALAGRRDELSAIRHAVDDVIEGGRRGAFFGGEPGVGKTRLVAEAARYAAQRGMVVLGGRCDVGMSNPFGIMTEALRQLVGAVDAPVLRSNLGRWPEELARVVPELIDALPGLGRPLASDLETERWRLLDAFSSAMGALAAPGGLMLVVDDAQWAPAATVAVLRHLLRPDGPERLLVLGTHRDSEQDMSAAWLDLLADAARLDHVERHTLVGLDDSEMVELVAAITGHPPASAQEFSAVMRRLTGGNAFFATELLRDLDDHGQLVAVDGELELVSDLDSLGFPAEVGDVIHHRVAILGAGVESVLTAAAVASVGVPDFSVSAIEPLLQDTDPLDCLERASRANLLREVGPDTWRFVHALVPTTLYQAASQTRRARMHRKLAVALEGADELSPASIARHWSLASGTDAAAAAARWFVEAARTATADLAPAEAVERYRAALEHDRRAGSSRFDPAEHLAVRIELGAALRRAGDPSSSDVLTAAALDAQSQHRPELMGRALVADTRGFWNSIGRHDDARVAMIEAGLELLPAADSELRARLLAGLASELLFHPRRDARFELADEAVAMALRLGDDAITFDISLQHVLATSSADRVDAHWSRSLELEELADRIGDPHRKVLAVMARYFVGLQAGHVAEAAPATSDAMDLAVELGQPMLMWLAGALRAGLLEFQGDLGDAELAALTAFGHGQVAGEEDAFVWFSGQLAAIRLQQDRLEEIIDLVADFVAANAELPAWHAVLAVAMCELGRFDQARAAFEVLSADHFAAIPNDQLRTATLCLAAEACRHVGRHAETAALYDLIGPLGSHHGSMAVFSTGSVQRPLGVLATMLGSHDRAEAHLLTAIDDNAAAGSPLWAATATADLAALHLLRNDRASALDAIERAEAMVEAIGAPRVARLCDRLRSELTHTSRASDDM